MNRKIYAALGAPFVVFALAVAITAFAQGSITWVAANEKTVAWDAVTTLEDGTTIPAGSAITYEVFRAGEGRTNVTAAGATSSTQFTVAFPAEGKWLVGVRAKREMTDPNNPATVITEYSATSWSDDPVATTPGPFGIITFKKPASPKGMRSSG